MSRVIYLHLLWIHVTSTGANFTLPNLDETIYSPINIALASVLLHRQHTCVSVDDVTSLILSKAP